MAEQTFRSPGFFEQEIDLSARQVSPFGTPAGVIGTAKQGPAFVPVTVGSFADFELKFGSLDTNRFGPYAVREFLKNRTALTYMRVLGAGANESSTDFDNTRRLGTVKNAGFKLTAADVDGSVGESRGCVQFIVAAHNAATNEARGVPLLSHNDSVQDANAANLVRGMVLLASGTRMQILSNDAAYSAAGFKNLATAGAIAGSPLKDAKYFKLVLSSSTGGVNYGSDEGFNGIRILSASLDPNDGAYISKILNTDPRKFQSEEHLLYLHFDVEHEVAPINTTNAVALVSGSHLAATPTTDSYRDLFGRFDTRYRTPRTTDFISQPFGTKEYDLFHVETISDGAFANDEFKISIANVRASTDAGNPYGTFELQVRAFGDTDINTEILERYPELTLNPKDDRYIARVIGDKKAFFDFDQEDPDERRLIVIGKYPNVSNRIRIRMNPALEEGEIPKDAVPFGFRGIPVVKTTDTLTDSSTTALDDSTGVTIGSSTSRRLGAAALSETAGDALSGSIVPPLPYRFKVTRGQVNSSAVAPAGDPGTNERVDGRLYWGVKSTRIPTAAENSNGLLDANIGKTFNQTVRNYTKLHGITGIDSLLTGSAVDEFNNNKFTLARVAFNNRGTSLANCIAAVTGTAREHIKEAAYIRNGDPHKTRYTVVDPVTGGTSDRVTLASLVHSSSVKFNRFTSFAKFTNIFYGGFDGVNILDKDAELFRDRAFSIDTGGKAIETDPDIGIGDGTNNPMGKNKQNNAVSSFRKAVDIMTDPLASNINILAIPGVRDTFVTDHALDKVEDYGFAIYVMDSLKYDEDENRLYDDSEKVVDPVETAEQFEARAVDNNYAATFFPDVFIDDPVNNTVVKVPASVAAIGTLGFNDNVAFPWFAPAGFNRGGLDFVKNVETRLSADDRDVLYDARVNPIAVFPRTGFVVFGQKTLQQAKSALDRINVRRLMLEVKRQVVGVAERLLFEPNTPATRASFIARVTPLLGLIQAQAGIEQFKVIMDDTNNTVEDVENNKLNGRIVVVPTRAVEFIAIDFIITNSGVSFE